MVKSILDNTINYPEIKKLDKDDLEFDATVYEIEILGVTQEIALGQAKYSFIQKNIIYYPIYLVVKDKVDSQIGLYEILADREPNILDEDGDIDIERLNEPLFYNYFIEDFIEKSSHKKISDEEKKRENEQEKTDEEESEEEEDEEEEDEGEEDEGEEDESDEEYDEWIKQYMKSNFYEILDNEGGGDCLFASIRDGLKTIGRDITIGEMRKILAEQVTEELFSNWKLLYDETKTNYEEIRKIMRELNTRNKELKTKLSSIKNRKEQQEIIKEARENTEKFKTEKDNEGFAKEMLEEFNFMEGVNTIEDLRKKIQTSSFWGETWSISTLERELKLKFVLFSEQSFEMGDQDNVLNCGQLNDTILQDAGVFNPTHYIMLAYSGNHYELIKYNKKGAFTYDELPEKLIKLIKDKCLERQAGPYYLIPEFREYDIQEKIDSKNEGEELDEEVMEKLITPEKELYKEDVVFQYYSKSAGNKFPGEGAGEILNKERKKEFIELSKIPDWRRKLSNFWESNLKLDGKTWKTVEHYYQGNKYKNNNPDFYQKFTIESSSDISKDPALAKAAGGPTGKYEGKKVRDDKIKIDPGFFDKKDEVMTIAQKAKYEQNKELADILLKTKDAKLMHFKRGSEPERQDVLMKIRSELITSTD